MLRPRDQSAANCFMTSLPRPVLASEAEKDGHTEGVNHKQAVCLFSSSDKFRT